MIPMSQPGPAQQQLVDQLRNGPPPEQGQPGYNPLAMAQPRGMPAQQPPAQPAQPGPPQAQNGPPQPDLERWAQPMGQPGPAQQKPAVEQQPGVGVMGQPGPAQPGGGGMMTGMAELPGMGSMRPGGPAQQKPGPAQPGLPPGSPIRSNLEAGFRRPGPPSPWGPPMRSRGMMRRGRAGPAPMPISQAQNLPVPTGD